MRLHLGFFGVLVFFGLSGRLITQSWARDPNPPIFLLKRCLRIFPALILVVIVTVFVLGPIFTQVGMREYFSSATTWKYFTNVVFLTRNFGLPGVFETNPFRIGINGSLWTLPWEFALYLSVLATGMMGFLRRKYWVSIAVLLLTILAAAASFNTDDAIINRSQLLLMFWCGAWMQASFQNGKMPGMVDLVLGLSALLIMAAIGPHSLARTGLILFAGSLVWLAEHIQFGDQITRRIGDLSYGMYIWGFPVQQSLIAAFGKEAFPYFGFLAITCAITFLLALLSWHIVEKRFIRMKRALVATSKPAPQSCVAA